MSIPRISVQYGLQTQWQQPNVSINQASYLGTSSLM
jgi:hypothetical protein